jgi:hypothetical protein
MVTERVQLQTEVTQMQSEVKGHVRARAQLQTENAQPQAEVESHIRARDQLQTKNSGLMERLAAFEGKQVRGR